MAKQSVSVSVVCIVTTMPYRVDSYQGLYVYKTRIYTFLCMYIPLDKAEIRLIQGVYTFSEI